MFPIVCYMAWDLHTTLASTMAPKSAFSVGKRVLDIRRYSQSKKSREAFVYLKDWMNVASRMQNMSLENKSDEDANETDGLCD